MLLKTTVLLVFILSFIFEIQTTLAQNENPNIIWLLAEDLSPDLGCYGNGIVQTPNIDQLASNGHLYHKVFTTSPVCSPSRTALGTGMYQNSIGAYHMRYAEKDKPELPEGIIPLTKIFNDNGYFTAKIKDEIGTGKSDWMFKVHQKPFQGNSWEDIKNHQPFFAQVNFRLTHRDFEEDKKRPISPEEVSVPPYYPDHPVVKQDWASYLESVQLLDAQVGQVIQKLKENGLYENTIIIFFSDHGRPFTRGKCFNYESGLQIPLIISIPQNIKVPKGYKNGKENSDLISAIDVAATSLALAGISKPEYMEGKVFLGKEKEVKRKYIFSSTDRIGETFFKTRSIRTEKFRYNRNYNHGFSINEGATYYRKAKHPVYHVLNILDEKGMLTSDQARLLAPLPEEELYDLERDPFELQNLATAPEWQKEKKRLSDILDKWLEDINDKGLEEDSENIKQHFEDYRKMSFERYSEAIEKQKARVMTAIEQKP